MQVDFVLRVTVYLVCFALSFFGMSALNYERFLKPGHVLQAQILYWLMILALAYLSGSFVLQLVYRI